MNDLIEIGDPSDVMTIAEPVVIGEAMLSAEEARQIVKNINGRLEQSRKDLLELYDREGWKALGYSSWGACVRAEFEGSSTALYRQLAAAKIERDVFGDSRIGNPVPASQLEAAAKAPPEKRAQVFDRADALAGAGPRTARHIAQAAAEIEAPELPVEFAIVQRRFENHAHVLSAAWDGQTRRYVVRKDGGTGVVMLWPDVLTKLEKLEAEPESPAHADNAASYDAKAARDSDRLERAHNLITIGQHAAAHAILDQVEVSTWDRDKLLATIPACAEPVQPPAMPTRPKRPVSADASAVIVYLKQMEKYASALEAVIMELQRGAQ
jgi:hypothetical protein